MRRAIEAVLVVLIAALALPTPAVNYTSAPPGPTAAEVAEFNRDFADSMWSRLPSSEGGDRPIVEVGEPLRADAWASAFSTCVEGAGASGSISSLDGFSFQSGGQTDDEMLVLYRCVAAHPQDNGYGAVMSAAQVDYAYARFARWLVPCLIANGYRLSTMPTYEEFVELRGDWSPYWTEMTRPDGKAVIAETDYDRARQVCGEDFLGF